MKAVANPRLGEDILRLGRVILEFVPQRLDVCPQEGAATIRAASPCRPGQSFVRQRRVRVGHQDSEKIEFPGRQMYVLSFAPENTAFQVEFKTACANERRYRAAARSAPQNDSHP